jgi:hypothetical protein
MDIKAHADKRKPETFCCLGVIRYCLLERPKFGVQSAFPISCRNYPLVDSVQMISECQEFGAVFGSKFQNVLM